MLLKDRFDFLNDIRLTIPCQSWLFPVTIKAFFTPNVLMSFDSASFKHPGP